MRLSLLASRSALCVLSLLVLTGCDPIIRTYGAYGNVEAHKVQMALATENFEASLARNRADLTRLARAAAADPTLGAAAENMAALVTLQEAVVAEHHDRLAELEDTDDYRDLNRAYGAMITEHQIIADRYADIAEGLRPDTTVASYLGSVVEKSRYAFVPPQYHRVNNLLQPSCLDAIASPAPPNAEPSAVPDTAATAPTTPADTLAPAGVENLP